MSILKGTREHVWSAVMKTTGRLQQWHLHSIALYGLKIATFLEQVLRHGRPIALSCILRDEGVAKVLIRSHKARPNS